MNEKNETLLTDFQLSELARKCMNAEQYPQAFTYVNEMANQKIGKQLFQLINTHRMLHQCKVVPNSEDLQNPDNQAIDTSDTEKAADSGDIKAE